jgi:outer membrane protein assembly factor BamB
MERATTAIVYVWGENERLKAYNIDLASKRITGFRGEGFEFASGQDEFAPGGMPVGRDDEASTGVVWGVYPVKGNANTKVVPGALVAYDATAVANGKLKRLFWSNTVAANNMGNFAKYSTPVVANGKVYVGTFSNKVVQYGL